MRSSTRRRGPPRLASRGAAALEFALVLPLFALLVMGAADYGYFFFCQQVVTNAAREGARAGTLTNPVTTPPSSGAQTSARTAAQTAAQQYMQGSGVSCPNGGTSCINAQYTTTGGNPAIDVIIQYNSRSLTGFTGFALPTYVYGHATMRWQ